MAESNFTELPSWVSKSDGRVVPFEPDEICQAIFAATEEMHQPNGFLARELTDGVLHFLAQEHGAGTPSTQQIAELVVKVLRELGQPALAQAREKRRAARAEGYETRETPHPDKNVTLPVLPGTAPEPFLDECLRLYSLHAVFSRDLAAARDEGFLSLAGLERPAEIAGGVLPWPEPAEGSLLAAILHARRRFGEFIALDSPEYDLDQTLLGPRKLVEQLEQGLRATRLRAVVNLNIAEKPAWVLTSGDGPLFQALGEPDQPGTADSRVAAARLALLDALLEQSSPDGPVRVDWHLGERDFGQPGFDKSTILYAALQRFPISFVFDRPSAPIALAEGLDRRHSAVLQAVGLHLTRLADMEGTDGGIDGLLHKLLHLARMALSAGVQKRRFLKQRIEHGDDLWRGFYLDRARLAVVPVGLAGVVQRFTGQGIAAGKQGQAMARQIVQRLEQVLEEAGRSANLEAVLDSPWWTARQPEAGALFRSPHLVGLTSADFAASAEDQLRAAGSLHQVAGSGTATLLLPANTSMDVGKLAELLHLAWKKTSLVRLRIHRIVEGESGA